MKSARPVLLGITLGDPAGIGPEVALKAAYGRRWPAELKLILVGSRAVLRRECRRGPWALPPAWSPDSREPAPAIAGWDPEPGMALPPATGRCTARAAQAAVAWIRAATTAAQAGRLQGIVTGPICKEGLAKAGIPYPGHTEMLAALTGVKRFAMMLIGGPLRVVLATRHIPLARVSRSLRSADILEAGGMAAQGLQWLGIGNRSVGICALNPHAGDGGTIGREEHTVILPAIRRLRRQGIDVVGPVPADVIFHQAVRGRYGAVVAMYHDQGLGPLKMLAFDRGVNLTLGLPIVRTSPDHGTAFDIAGRGLADPRSMIAAIQCAFRLARRSNPFR